MHYVETKNPFSIVKKYKLFYIDCAADCMGMTWQEVKAFVTQFEADLCSALVDEIGEDLSDGYQVWNRGWTSSFKIKTKHQETFFRIFDKVKCDFVYIKPEENIPSNYRFGVNFGQV